MPSRIARNRILLLLATATLMALVYSFPTRKTPDGRNAGPSSSESSTSDERKTASATSDRSTKTRGQHDSRQLDLTVAALKGIDNVSEARQILSDLRSHLASLPAETAAGIIADFLRNPARDAATQIGFSIGKSGFLDGQPSLRVALLDWLGQIAPAQAGAVAARILASPTHPDEWAVCLRNYARAYPDPDSREFLRAKTEELIRNPAWRGNPSVGFLEAFDVLVHTHATESTVLLSELVANQTPQGKALAHAAYLTLDRLTICEPVAMMGQLTTQPDLTRVRGPMVANLFARADLRDPEQRQFVRDYLLDPVRAPEELAAFSGVYPNANLAISKNLLTETRTPTGDEIIAHDKAALQIVQQWVHDPGFEHVRLYLSAMQNRLSAFVAQASR
jgi:hypothetical protein